MSGVKGKSGRKTTRGETEIISARLPTDIIEWLKQNGNQSAEIEKIVREKMDAQKIIRKFTETVADAYVNQYVDPEGHKVMNQPVVYFNRTSETFGWCSSLTPLSDDEVEVERLEEGMYGETGDDPEIARAAITDFATEQTEWHALAVNL